MNYFNFVSLGGQDETGKNSFVLELGQDLLLFNFGFSLPNEVDLGIKKIIPDCSYLLENKARLKGLFVGNAKIENIGGLEYLVMLIPDLKVYCSLASKFLIEKYLVSINPRLLTNVFFQLACEDKEFNFGDYVITHFKVVSNQVDSLAWIIKHCDYDGHVIILDDFVTSNENYVGFNNQLYELVNLQTNKNLLITSVGQVSNHSGYTSPHHNLNLYFDKLNEKAANRLVIAFYENNFFYLFLLSQMCIENERPLAIYSKPMLDLFIGYLKKQLLKIDGLKLVSLEKAAEIDNVVIVITEQKHRLTNLIKQICHQENSKLKFQKTDFFALVTITEPGLERHESDIIDEVSRCDVKNEKLPRNYLSLLASGQDHLGVINVLKPKFIIPVGGLYKDFIEYAQLVSNANFTSDIKLLYNGEFFTMNNNQEVKPRPSLCLYEQYIDDINAFDLTTAIIYERKVLSDSGILTISMIYHRQLQNFNANVKINAFGLMVDDHERKTETNKAVLKIINEEIGKKLALDRLIKPHDIKTIKQNLSRSIARYYERVIQKTPLVVFLITEN